MIVIVEPDNGGFAAAAVAGTPGSVVAGAGLKDMMRRRLYMISPT